MRRKNQETVQVNKVINQLKKKKQHITKELETVIATFLTETKNKLEEIEAIDEVISQLSSEETKQVIRLMSYKRKTLVETIYELLKERPMHYIDILNTLHKMGINIKGKNPEANILSVLSRDQRFIRVKRGVYRAS